MRANVLAAALPLAVGALVLHGWFQPQPVLLVEGGCPGCRIEVDSIAYLGSLQENVSPRSNLHPVMDSRKRLFAIEHERRAVLVYDSTGRFQARLGRPGSGPGEFSIVLSAVHIGPGDSVFVLDRYRAYVFAPDLSFVRRVPLPPADGIDQSSTAVLSGGTILRVSGRNQITAVASSESPGVAQQVSIAAADTSCVGWCGWRSIVAGDQPNAFWTLASRRYLLEQVSLSGTSSARLERRAPWFNPLDVLVEATILTRLTHARVMGMQRRADNTIWVYVFAVDASDPFPSGTDVMAMSDNDALQDAFFQRHFATYVDVIEPATRRVLATRKFKAIMVPVGSDHAATLNRDPSAITGITVHRISLQR